MRSEFKKTGIVLVILFMSTTNIYATSWPVFAAPDSTSLMNLHAIDTSQCPPGQGKLMPNININVHQNLCKSFCPESWTWIANTDGECHDLKNGFLFQDFAITHIPDDNGSTSYSIVTAHYSDGQNSFTFTSTPGEYWHCIIMNKELRLITCADDI